MRAPAEADVTDEDVTDERGPGHRASRGIGVGAFAVALVVFCLHLGRPAYWLDESFTIDLTRRSWYQLARVSYYTDTPLAPYYGVMKPWLSISTAEWWARLPSALAAAAAVGVLAAFVARTLGATAAVGAAGVLVVLPTVSRYAQEARPYGIALLLTVLTAVAWWSYVSRGGRRRGLLLALSVALVPLAHLLALTAVAAQLLVTPVAAPAGRRLQTSVRTALWAALGAVVVSPYIALTVHRAIGVAHPRPSSLANDWLTVRETFGTTRVTWAVLILAAVGLVGLLRRGPDDVLVTRRRVVLALGVSWAVLPVVLLCLAAAAGSKTLIDRYFLVATPGWALLAGAGCAVLAAVLAGALGAVAHRAGSVRIAGIVAGVGVPVVLVGALGLHRQETIRTDEGHANADVRPAVALLRTPAEAGDAIVLPSVSFMVPFEAYGPDLVGRMPLRRDPVPSAALVLPGSASPAAKRRMARYQRIAVVVQGPVTAAQFYAQHTPGATDAHPVRLWSKDGWSIAVLQR